MPVIRARRSAAGWPRATLTRNSARASSRPQPRAKESSRRRRFRSRSSIKAAAFSSRLFCKISSLSMTVPPQIYEIISLLNSPRNNKPAWAASLPAFSRTCFSYSPPPWFSARARARMSFLFMAMPPLLCQVCLALRFYYCQVYLSRWNAKFSWQAPLPAGRLAFFLRFLYNVWQDMMRAVLPAAVCGGGKTWRLLPAILLGSHMIKRRRGTCRLS